MNNTWLFIMSVIFLAGLIAGAARLQTLQDQSTTTYEPPTPTLTTTPAPATTTQQVAVPHPTLRPIYNREIDD